MKILVIEDEMLVAESLIRQVKLVEPGAEIVGPLPTVKESLQWLSANEHPDLILSDIQLADGISLDLFSSTKISCPVIFTTAYNEYAIRAFKVNSIDYLLKPIDKNELAAAFGKFRLLQSKFSDNTYIEQMKELFANFTKSKQYKERFAVHVGRSVTLVPVEQVAMFIKEELIYLVNHEGNRYITDYRSLDEVEELVDPRDFYRVNRQHLVRLGNIESYRSDDTGKIVVKLKGIKTSDLIVSKEKASEFRKWFD